MTTVAGREALVEGEFVFTAEDFRHIAQTLHAHAGIALSEGKAALVYSRLAKRLRVLGLRSFRDYCALIDGVEGVDERQAMIVDMRFFVGLTGEQIAAATGLSTATVQREWRMARAWLQREFGVAS